MPVRLWRLVVAVVALSIVLACPFQSVAQSSDSKCLALFQQYLDANRERLDFGERKAPRPVPNDPHWEANYQQQFAEWKSEESDRWQKVIDAGRRYLGNCQAGKSETDVLRDIAEGLRIQGHGDDALPIVKRCLSINPNHSSCWLELGMVEERFPICQDNDAKEAFKKVIQIGGFTEVNAGNVKLAKFELEEIDDARFFPVGCPARSKEKQAAPVASPMH